MLEINGILIQLIHQTFFSCSSRAFSDEIKLIKNIYALTISIIPNELGWIC